MRFGLRRWISYILTALLPLIIFVVVFVMQKELLTSLIFGMAAAIPACLLGRGISNHPFIRMLEGSTLVTYDVTSAGFMVPISARVELPYIRLPNGLKTIFDKAISFYLKVPVFGKLVRGENVGKEPGKQYIELPDKEEYNKKVFGFEGYPCFIYNSKLNSFVTKEFLSEKENKLLTEHLSIVNLDQVRALRRDISNLLKYAVDQFKPAMVLEFLVNPLVQGIIVLMFLVFGIMFVAPQLPKIWETIGGTAAKALPGAPVTKQAAVMAFESIKGVLF